MTASSGFRTGILVREFRPHVLVLDIGLDDIDGRDVCLTLRNDPMLDDVKIVGISGIVSPGEGRKMLAEGFDHFQMKPFDARELVNTVRDMLVSGPERRKST